MKAIMSRQAVDLWEAWVDLLCTDGISRGTLFVWGDVFVSSDKVDPILVKKEVQGGDPAHLYLEIVPYILKEEGRLTEVRYSEPVYNLEKYQQIFICMGEEVLAEISEIEMLS